MLVNLEANRYSFRVTAIVSGSTHKAELASQLWIDSQQSAGLDRRVVLRRFLQKREVSEANGEFSRRCEREEDLAYIPDKDFAERRQALP